MRKRRLGLDRELLTSDAGTVGLDAGNYVLAFWLGMPAPGKPEGRDGEFEPNGNSDWTICNSFQSCNGPGTCGTCGSCPSIVDPTGCTNTRTDPTFG